MKYRGGQIIALSIFSLGLFSVAPSIVLAECGQDNLQTKGSAFDPSYHSVEYSPEGYPIFRLRASPFWTNSINFNLSFTFLNDECIQSSVQNNSLSVFLPQGISKFSIRFSSPTHFDIWNDDQETIIVGANVTKMPDYSHVYFSGITGGGFHSFKTKATKYINGAIPPVISDTLPAPVGCPSFSVGGSNPYLFDNYERAEYVDGLLRVHLRFKSPYNDGRGLRGAVATSTVNCEMKFPNYLQLSVMSQLTPYVRYYSLRMISQTEWQLWDDENNTPFNCVFCSGLIAPDSSYISLRGNIDAGASVFTTTPFPPVIDTNSPPVVSDLSQRKSDNIMEIIEGGRTSESEIYFNAKVNDPEENLVKIQVEVRPLDQNFDGLNVIESPFVPSGSDISLAHSNIEDGFYHWRARVLDEDGSESEWVEFGEVQGGVDFEIKQVPLYTQVVSEESPGSVTWFDKPYAEGRGNIGLDRCGESIADCGCAITSAVMVLRYYGVTSAVDGQEVQPLNIDRWLLANNGYIGNGNVSWPKIAEYSKDQSGFARLKYDGRKDIGDSENTTLAGLKIKTDEYINQGKPVIIKSKSFGHFLVTTEKLSPTYAVRDPAWFNTKKLDELETSKVLHVRDYNNIFDGIRLFSQNTVGGGIDGIAFNLASPAELIVTDPFGRRLGKDPTLGIFYNEIPDASYGTDGISNADIETPQEPHEVKSIWIPSIVDGNYKINVIGTGEGEYTLSSTVYRGGDLDYENSIKEETTLNKIDSFTLKSEEGSEDIALIATTTINASADTFILQEAPNQNEGISSSLQLKSAGDNRILLYFDEESIHSRLDPSAKIISAKLIMYALKNKNNWSGDERVVTIHRMIHEWNEFGATWNCPNDINTDSFRPDCEDGNWNMNNKKDSPWITNESDSVIITNETMGPASFDVTEDVKYFISGGINNGWIIKKTEEGKPGYVEFGSRESDFIPQLIINYEL